ncbi:carbohydrate-binding domain-containing protein [Luteococcus peritonei]|uniref:Carbohydrate-binding domain-containing protein n=1 Tax=Luteococcus peritonei TaxID=88874 RepID=A0ABW4RT95_9ACTN
MLYKRSTGRPVLAASFALATVCSLPTLASAADTDNTQLVVEARADSSDGVGAITEISVNGQVLTTTEVTSTSWAPLTVTLPKPLASGDTVSVRFTNDATSGRPDRNLWVREIRSGDVELASTAQGVTYNRGATPAKAVDGQGVTPGQEVLPWEGALNFPWPAEVKIVSLPVQPAPAEPTATTQPTALATSEPVATAESTHRTPSGAAVFGAGSFWNQQIPAGAPLHPNSAALVDTLVDNLKFQGKASLNTTAYAPPVYVVDSSTPRRAVSNWLCNGASDDPAWLKKNWDAQFSQVPIPADVQPAGGEDQEIVIWSPSTGELWEMWRFQHTDGGFRACWGGKVSDTSASDGVHPYPFGVTASGLSLLGGTVRVSELKQGRIDHAIAIGVNAPRKGAFSWPANRTDGTSDSPNALMEGQRLRLDPSIDVDQLKISPVAKIIAKAAQEYGMVVRDNTGGPLVVYGEDSSPYTRAGKENPYNSFGAVQYDWMVGFPWDKMQALPKDYGKP